MAAKKVRFATHDPWGMRPANANLPAKYHRGHIDQLWQSDLLLPWEPTDAIYLRKVERAIPFRFMFDATSTSSLKVEIIDKDWMPVLTPIAMSATSDVPGNLAEDGSQFHSYIHRLSNLSGIAADGTYCLLLSVDYNGTDKEQYVSHPFSLKDTHEGTMLVEFTSTKNDQGGWFEQLPCRYAVSVEAYLGRGLTKSVRTVFQDQNLDIDQLYAKTFRIQPLHVGHTGEGIPDWFYDCLCNIFALDTVLLNGTQFRQAEGAEWVKDTNDTAPLFGVTVNVQEAVRTREYGANVLDLYTSPGYPYAVHSLAIGVSSPSLSIIPSPAYPALANGAVIRDGTEETAFIAALNAAASSFELLGTFGISAGVIQYTNGTGENYSVAAPKYYTDKFGWQFQCPGSPNNVRTINVKGANIIVDWGDGTLDRVAYAPTGTVLTHTFPIGIATYNIKVYGFLEVFSMLGQGNMGNLTGLFPQGLKKLLIDPFAFTSDTFPFSTIGAAQNTLNLLSLTNCGLVSCPGFNSIYFPYLSYIDFSFNNMTSVGVSNFMYDVWFNSSNNNAGPFLSGGTFNITNQATPATLNAKGNGYKSMLKSSPLNWKVNN